MESMRSIVSRIKFSGPSPVGNLESANMYGTMRAVAFVLLGFAAAALTSAGGFTLESDLNKLALIMVFSLATALFATKKESDQFKELLVKAVDGDNITENKNTN